MERATAGGCSIFQRTPGTCTMQPVASVIIALIQRFPALLAFSNRAAKRSVLAANVVPEKSFACLFDRDDHPEVSPGAGSVAEEKLPGTGVSRRPLEEVLPDADTLCTLRQDRKGQQ